MTAIEQHNLPLVSICIPTYNGETYLQEALDSIQNQDYQNLEIVISDDNSSDNTVSILQKFRNNVGFPVKIISHIPKGIGANWNNCIKYASGTYIKFLFQDDVLLKTCVSDMVYALEGANSDVMFAYCKKELIGSFSSERQFHENELFEKYSPMNSNQILKDPKLYSQPRNKIGEPVCVLFKKEVFEKVGWFDERLRQSLDYEYLYRVMSRFQIIAVPKTLVQFRVHQQQASYINNREIVVDSYLLPKSLLGFSHKLHIKTRIILLYKFISGSIQYFIFRKFSANS